MKIISTNLAQERTIQWKGRAHTTGIYKLPTDAPIQLGKETVQADHIANRAVHGGEDKACYIYGYNNYPFWQNRFPDLDWAYGMMGENLTIDHLDEAEAIIGNIYQLGEATVQISRPRQPCFKFAAKFGDEAVIELMIDHLLTGTYLRVIETGVVRVGDEFKLIKAQEPAVSIKQLVKLMFHYDSSQDHAIAEMILEHPAVSESDKKYIRRRM